MQIKIQIEDTHESLGTLINIDVAVGTIQFNRTLLLLNITTLNAMQITFDEEKDALNKSKHGLSLSEAAKLEWDDALIWQAALWS